MRLANYLRYRRIGLSDAWELAGMDDWLGRALHAAGWMVCLATFLMIASGFANASIDASSREAAKNMAAMQAEIEGLRAIVAKCLTDGTGGHIAIGNTHYLCGITEIGTWGE